MEIPGRMILPGISACQKSLAEFAAISGEDVSIIFGRGVYVDENTSRPANVRIGRCWRTMRALRQGANFLSKNPQVFRQSHPPGETVSSGRMIYWMFFLMVLMAPFSSRDTWA